MALSDDYRVSYDEHADLLSRIRSYAAEKSLYQPAVISAEEYCIRAAADKDMVTVKGLASIGKGAIDGASGAIAVMKAGGRDNGKVYYIFETPEQLRRYSDACSLLGAAAYYLFESKLNTVVRSAALNNGLPETACEEVQDAVEFAVGINYHIPDPDISDDCLSAALYVYIKRTTIQKASEILGKLKNRFIYIDSYDYDFTGGSEDDIPSSVSAELTEPDSVSITRLADSIGAILRTLTDDSSADQRCDIKDSLLPKVACSRRAAVAFIREYYERVGSRSSVWRSVALAYQLVYSGDNGLIYLKNTAFIKRCGDTAMSEMICSQRAAAEALKERRALTGIDRTEETLRLKGILFSVLNCFASSPVQIGKALSKELRTRDALEALSTALAVYAAEETGYDKYCGFSGEEAYHE